MNAITLWQPWASLIALGYKTIETRGHSSMSGLAGQRIAIHAGKTFEPGIDDYIRRFLVRPIRPEDIHIFNPRACIRSAVLCTAHVSEARWLAKGYADNIAALGDCSDGRRFGLVLRDIQLIDPPVHCAGRQGIWTWDATHVPPPAPSLFDETE